jgi:dTDP-4-dehydrorhamnose 3,5-epimerase
MQVDQLGISGAVLITPPVHDDDRGSFLEWFRADVFEKATGHPFTLAQANTSVSAAGTIRGIHFADVPPGQAKYVTCPRGEILDVIVDIRVGSPTYGTWETVSLDDRARKALYLGEGLGHAFIAMEDDTVVSYLCSTAYNPEREHAVNPKDESLAIDWPVTDLEGRALEHRISPKDAQAPGLEEARETGLLPRYDDVRTFLDELRSRAAAGQ